MLRRTIDLSHCLREKHADEEGELGCIENVKNKLEIILEHLMDQRAAIQRQFLEEKRSLEEELETKNARIEKLQQKIRQLQGENQQFKYQYQQRVSLMVILKNQNALISKELAREKEQVKLTIQTLVDQNRQLKDALIEAHFEERRKRRLGSPETIMGKNSGQKFYSSKDLNKDQASKKSEHSDWRGHILTEGHLDTEFEDDSVSKSSIAAILRTQQKEFKQSRMTKIKGRGSHFQEGLQKMSTRTHLSRMRGAE